MRIDLATALFAVALAAPTSAAAGDGVRPLDRVRPGPVTSAADVGWAVGTGTDVPAAPNVRTFTVTGPGGVPAVGATVMAWVLRRGPEPRRIKPYVFHADAAGLVRMVVPLDDTVIRSRPTERLFNAVAIVLDAGPGASAAPVVMPFILNLGDPLWPVDPTRVEGSVVRLATASPHALTRSAPSWNDADGCAQLPGGVVCTETTYPESLRAVPVPIAANFGAGADFTTSVEYTNSRHTTTSSAVGTDGVLVEVMNSATAGDDSSVAADVSRVGVRGGTSDEELRLATQFKQVRTYACAGGGCEESILVTPDRMTGTTSAVTSLSLHDQMSQSTGSLDCGNYVDVNAVYNNTQGRTRQLSFEVGVDINAQIKFINLHAMSVYEQYSELRDTASYAWSVKANPTYPHHYLYVPGGLAHYDPSQPSGGNESCPLTNPGNTFTHATTRSDLTPDAPGDPPFVTTPRETQPVKEGARRCQAAPDRCGRE